MKGKYLIAAGAVLLAASTIFLIITLHGTGKEVPETEIIESTAPETVATAPPETTPAPTETEPEPAVECKILAIGDMLMHRGISIDLQSEDGVYHYEKLFENIRENLEWADLAIVNNEVIFGGDELGPVGYPGFSVPSSLGDAEIAAGFNVILSATNHTNDQNAAGIRNTLNYWAQHPEITLLGIHDVNLPADPVTVVEKNGITFGLYNLTYGLNVEEIEPEYGVSVDLMTDDRRQEIAEKLRWADANTDFVIVFPHWGEEYELEHNERQQEWAQFFAENGADLIIGSHTHTVQESEWVKSPANENAVAYCVYSMGNYVSLQAMTIDMVGKMPEITVEKDSEGCRIKEARDEYVLTWFDPPLEQINVYRMDQVTDELIASHGVVGSVNEEYYNRMNEIYPMTRSVLESLCK